MSGTVKTMPKAKITGLKDGVALANDIAKADPVVTKALDGQLFTNDNFSSLGALITQDDNLMNSFYHTLIDKVGLTWVASNEFYNKLKFLKKDYLQTGSIVEEIAYDAIEAMPYNPEVDWQKALKNFPFVTAELFHRLNRADVYPVTINQMKLKQAFFTPQSFRDFVVRELENLTSSNEMDEFGYCVQTANHLASNVAYPIAIGGTLATVDEYKHLLATINTYAEILTMPSRSFNKLGFKRVSNIERLVLVTTPEVLANLNVNVNAPAYNLEYVKILASRTITVPEMPENCVAMLVDERAFQIYDIVYATDYNHNGITRADNYFLHVQQIFSTSPAFNCIKFVTVESVTAPVLGDFNMIDETELTKGQTYQVSCSVTSGYSKVTYSLEDATDENTQITTYGLLYIGQNEKATEIKVTATAIENVTKQATYKIKGNS